MKTLKDQIIDKYEELVNHLKTESGTSFAFMKWQKKVNDIERDIAALKSELSEPERDCENCDMPIPCNLECESDQFQEQPGQITDEEIEEKIAENAVAEFGLNVKGFYITERINGAKWYKSELEKRALSQKAQSITVRDDLKQYMTNALYAAHDWGGHKFDEWVEEMIEGIDEYFVSLKAQKAESKTINHCIILHSGRPLHNRIFTSVDSARNYIKMQFSKRKFSETEDNIFIDKNYGAKFEIVTLNSKHENI